MGSPKDIVPFATYLGQATRFRQAVKALKAAGRTTTEEAFTSDGVTANALNTQGKQAWEMVVTLLTESKHLATLRTRLVAPMLFESGAVWDGLAKMAAAQRSTTLAELAAMVAETGNPIVTKSDLTRAQARVEGNMLVTEGSAYGISASAVVHTIGANPFASDRENGGNRVSMRASPSDIGRQVAGLRGIADVTAEKVGDNVRFTIEVADRNDARCTMIPLTFRSAVSPQARA